MPWGKCRLRTAKHYDAGLCDPCILLVIKRYDLKNPVVIQFEFLGSWLALPACHNGAVKKKLAKKAPKRKPKLHSKEDFSEDFHQATFLAIKEVTRRSEEICATLPKP